MDPAQRRLMETVADIAYIAGGARYYSGDSREDISNFIKWAEEFESGRVYVEGADTESYSGKDYMEAIEAFAIAKLQLEMTPG